MNKLSRRTVMVCFLAICLLYYPAKISIVLQSHLLSHVLIQLSLLVALGWYWADVLPRNFVDAINQYNKYGLTGVVIITLSGLFWMLPRTLDASIDDKNFILAKGFMLIFLIGASIRITNHVIHPIVRGVWLFEVWAMLVRAGWIYTVSPERLCNNYLLNEQQLLGNILISFGLVWALIWILDILFAIKTMQYLRVKLRKQIM